MKKVVTLLTSFIFTVGFLFAQELSVKYEINMKSDDYDVQTQLGVMQGSTLQIFLKGNKSRTEMNMGGLMKTTTIFNEEQNKGVLIMDGMFGKQAATFDDKKNQETDSLDLDIEWIDESKDILGYTCKKAVISTEENTELIYWYTEEIDPKANSLNNYVKKEIPGFVLKFSVHQPQMSMTFTATEIQEKVKETKGMFDVTIPEGYTEKSFKEIQEMTGQ